MNLMPESVVEDGDIWIIAMNRNQNLLGKTVLVLRRPCTAVVDLTPEEWSSLHREVKWVTAALARLFQPDQFNYAFLMNLDAQVHLHVVPRYSADRTWHGMTFHDPDWGSAFGSQQHLLPGAEI